MIDQTVKSADSSRFFKNIMGSGGAAMNSNYHVQITRPADISQFEKYKVENLTEHLAFMCKTVVIPGKTLETGDMLYGFGSNYKFPTRESYDDLTLTFYCTQGTDKERGLPERRYFDAWMDTVVDSSTNQFNYKQNYTSDVYIAYVDEFGDRRYQTQVLAAYPIAITDQELSYEGKEVLELTVTLASDYILNNENMSKGDGEVGIHTPPEKTTKPKNIVNKMTPERAEKIRNYMNAIRYGSSEDRIEARKLLNL
tara:strand:- start:5889 stop:6650 length:762 start_codon:yes stop_codon:yes gene_type:complete